MPTGSLRPINCGNIPPASEYQPPPHPRLLPLLSLSQILFVSQCLANFALGCNFGSQENAPGLHNLVSRATVVIQLQSEMPRGGVDSQSDTQCK